MGGRGVINRHDLTAGDEAHCEASLLKARPGSNACANSDVAEWSRLKFFY
jgi:hypothetical protein